MEDMVGKVYYDAVKDRSFCGGADSSSSVAACKPHGSGVRRLRWLDAVPKSYSARYGLELAVLNLHQNPDVMI